MWLRLSYGFKTCFKRLQFFSLPMDCPNFFRHCHLLNYALFDQVEKNISPMGVELEKKFRWGQIWPQNHENCLTYNKIYNNCSYSHVYWFVSLIGTDLMTLWLKIWRFSCILAFPGMSRPFFSIFLRQRLEKEKPS